MSIAALSPPEQGQLVCVHSQQWIVNDVRPSTLPPPALKPSFTGPQHLLTLSSIEDSFPLVAFKEPPAELRAVRVVANEAAQEEKFVIPQNMQVPESSVIRTLFEADGERDAAGQEDLSWWESKGKRLERRAVAVEARKVADRVIAIVQPVEPVRPKVKGLFENWTPLPEMIPVANQPKGKLSLLGIPNC
jgi:hypothetical protein